ncbi:MAG: aminotransferase class I/II-fold pyridoxal phosphate-dependent enzyme [Acidobacteria bacterium]|nr:aminotransferase class I/II-fold pyridoxal phosphate-dependent enzyme [Acidobacteriota bacterium]
MDFEALFSADARVMQPSLIRRLTGLVNQPDVISFAAGSPSAETFPYSRLTEIYHDLATVEKGRLFQYSVTRGNAELVEAVRERTARVQGVAASADETMIVSGSQQGLDFIGRVLLDPGDAAFVEKPSFPGGIDTFATYRARLFGVTSHDDGMDAEDLARRVREARAAGHRPKLVYVIPNFQNPSGRLWSLERRRALLEVARAENLLIVEDDAYGELYFDGVTTEQRSRLKALDPEAPILYMSTYSKTLAAGLRVAWIMGPAPVISRLVLAKEVGDLCTSTLSQKLTLEFLRRGWMDEHLPGVRAFYQHKAQLVDAALHKHFRGLGRWTPPRGGLFVWVELESAYAIDTWPVLEASVAEDKVAFIPGKPFFVGGVGRHCLRLSYSNVTDDNIDKGLEKLSRRLRAARESVV